MYELFHRFRKTNEFDPGFGYLRAKCEQFCSVWDTLISIVGPKVDVPAFYRRVRASEGVAKFGRQLGGLEGSLARSTLPAQLACSTKVPHRLRTIW